MVEMVDAAARRDLAAELATYNTRVGQPDDPPLFTATPQGGMQVCHWRAEDLDRLLARLGEKLALQIGGIRRTLRLTNPGLEYGTTPTLWVSIQVILPGEIASAHRHAASALRFVMKGEGAETIVDGERYDMAKGDLVLTPSWAWHDHEHHGDEPMIWIDVLDISLVRHLQGVFFEGSEQPRREADALDPSFRKYGSGLLRPFRHDRAGFTSPVLAYSWDRARAALMLAREGAPDPFDDVLLEYQNPLSGESALPTIGTALQLIRGGASCRPYRHNGSVVFYVVEGAGTTIVDGREINWGKGDFVAIPPWAERQYRNDHADDAILFQVNDVPTLQRLGLFRENPMEPA